MYLTFVLYLGEAAVTFEMEYTKSKRRLSLSTSHIKMKRQITSSLDNEENHSSSQMSSQRKRQLVDDYAKYFKNKDMSDVILNVDDVAYHAHKLILSARSPVFAAMFKHEMMENRNHVVDIPEIKSNVFEIVLQYIYTGKVDGVQQLADEILSVADQYQLDLLKTACEHVMIGQLSTRNASKFLVLADLHSAEKLRKKTMRFINDNAKNLISRTDWKTFVYSYPHLLAELYEDIVSKM